MARVRFDVGYYAEGRYHVRTVTMDAPESGAIMDRLEMRVDDSLLLSVPMTMDSTISDDDEDEWGDDV